MGRRVGLARIEALFENLQREINLGKSNLKFSGNTNTSADTHTCTITGTALSVQKITADKTLTTADSGKVFILDSADESGLVSITLPIISDEGYGTGTTYKFIVTDASNGGFAILTGLRSGLGQNILIGHAVLVCAQVSSTTNGANGRIVVPDVSNDNTITLDRDATNGGGSEGTVVTITNVSSRFQPYSWFVEAIVHTSFGTSTGADIFSDTAA